MVGDLDHAPISNRVRLGPNRTGEGDVLRGNDGSRGRFEEDRWNSSSYSCWESGSNEEVGKDKQGVGGGVVVVLGNSVSSGLLVVVGGGFLLAPLLLAPKRPRSRGLLMSVDLAYPSSPTYTSVWRDGSGKPETERAILVGVKSKGVYRCAIALTDAPRRENTKNASNRTMAPSNLKKEKKAGGGKRSTKPSLNDSSASGVEPIPFTRAYLDPFGTHFFRLFWRVLGVIFHPIRLDRPPSEAQTPAGDAVGVYSFNFHPNFAPLDKSFDI